MQGAFKRKFNIFLGKCNRNCIRMIHSVHFNDFDIDEIVTTLLYLKIKLLKDIY